MKARCLNIFIIIFFLVIILGLIDKFSYTLTNYKQKIDLQQEYAWDNNLNPTHTFDLKIIIIGDIEHIFYTYKHILKVHSEYFDLYLLQNNTDVIHYDNITKQEFNMIVDIIYTGKFNTTVTIPIIPLLLRHLDTFKLINKYRNYTDLYLSNILIKNYKFVNDITYVMELYNLSKKHNMRLLQISLLNNIYYNWKSHGLFTENNLINYPALFCDYIKMIKCDRLSFDV